MRTCGTPDHHDTDVPVAPLAAQAIFKKECKTGSYKKALKQAKTPEQVAEVEKYQEARRVAWMEYHAACGDTSAALKYAVTDEEEEKCKQALACPLPSSQPP